MKKSIRHNATTIAVVAVLLAVVSGVIVIVRAGGLATRPVGEIHGKLEIKDDTGVQQCVVVTTLQYSQATKEGTAHVAIRRDGVRVASASARLKADTQELAAAAPSALLLYLTGRPARPGMKCQDIDEGGGRGMQCQDIKTDGNVRVLLEQADKIIDWWDAQASLTHPGYVSPKPDLSNVGRLHLNVWGNELSQATSAVVAFDPTNPGQVIGGVVHIGTGPGSINEISSGFLSERGDTAVPVPGDFYLVLTTQDGTFDATLLLEPQKDGTVDVRGVTGVWGNGFRNLVVEGVGSDKFVVPGQ